MEGRKQNREREGQYREATGKGINKQAKKCRSFSIVVKTTDQNSRLVFLLVGAIYHEVIMWALILCLKILKGKP